MAKKDTIIGLDIGCYSVKAAWVTQRSNACSVKRVEILKLPYDQSNREEVITSWLAGHGIGKYPCVLGISGQQVMFQPLQMADDDPRTMEQAAEMEVLKFRDITAETMTHGLAPFTLKPEDRRLLMAMARESALNDVLSLARNTRLDIVNLVPSPVALFNTFARMDNANNDGRPCIYANIGHVTTDIAVGIKHSLIFARSFAGGGQMFTIAVARTGHLTETQAEDWKIDKGSVSDDNNNSSAIKATADVWINEIQSCLAVYRNLFPNDETRPTQMIVSGGGSLLKGFPDYIAERLNINVRQPLMLPGNPKTDRPALFPTAIGLALSEDNAAAQINLLPNTIKDELIFRRQKPFWIAAAITAALILGISVACGFWQIKRYKKILNVQRTDLRQRQDLVNSIESIKLKEAQIREMSEPIKSMLAAGPLMRNLITLAARSTARGDWLTMIADADAYFEMRFSETPNNRQPNKPSASRRRAINAPIQADEPETVGIQRVIIEGYTRTPDLSTVQQFINSLTQADFVRSADLLGDDKIVLHEKINPDFFQPARMFVIDVRLVLQ